ncbi:ATP-binding cassette domain-containing protein [Atopobacter sp. AH10]|uniref:ABC transporter ATP-binding protein n=1 Tax=Atopobacter sp. AH10 TaxID=2315861 RepID=UPI000EF28D18|nr:ATP-binding cassette domain-containing protein [Atopobacter sp. AH10]RLK62877.1 ATP-binding cassette domain-containing protein [Atopobacter sp. AH10]
MGEVLLQLEHISKTFFPNTPQERKSLIDVNLTLNKGDFAVIVGGNGAGKSTLMNVIAGKLQADQGKIKVAGKDVSRLKEFERAKLMSRVHQDPALGTAPRMTMAQNMAIAHKRGQERGLRASVKEEDLPIYKERLKELGLGLEERLSVPMEHLSGGQRQAVALVMATLAKSDLLLLDEHTAALDPPTQRLVMTLTDRLVKRHQLTTLMITHSLSDAVSYGNRLFVLSQGKLIRHFSEEEKAKLTVDDLFHILEKGDGE